MNLSRWKSSRQLNVAAVFGCCTVAGNHRARSSCLVWSCAFVHPQKLSPTSCMPLPSRTTKSSLVQVVGLMQHSPTSCPNCIRRPRDLRVDGLKKKPFQRYRLISLTVSCQKGFLYLYAVQGIEGMQPNGARRARQVSTMTIQTS